ncbi:MAG: glycoside hydrolase family 6 protein [Gemmatimonadaceae bacterium]
MSAALKAVLANGITVVQGSTMQSVLAHRRLIAPGMFAVAVFTLAACGDALGPATPTMSNGDVEPGPPSSTPVTNANPIAGASFYVDPSSRARRTADDWRASRPSDAAQMDKIAAQPNAKWFGNWNTDVRGDVASAVDVMASAGATPVLVAYNIPLRDCGSYSAGGAANPEGYRKWISDFAAGIGVRKAVVVLEPDALGGMDCLSATHQSTRTELLRYAVDAFRAGGATSVYIDAGNSRWHSPATIAARLMAAGIEHAAGFSLNVSNFFTTAEESAYGDAISALVGGKHYLIDTSRNGNGPTANAQWCNPDGRALGERPTTATGNPLVDAYLWIKVPGESDGSCNGYPNAGVWVPEYALGLAQRATY